jgi:hypothetical protein
VWFNQHYKEIESKYDERWIVINQGAIIHSDTNLDILFKRLRNQYNYIGSFFIEHMGAARYLPIY